MHQHMIYSKNKVIDWNFMRKTALLAAATAAFLIAPFAVAQETQPEAPAPTEEPSKDEPVAAPNEEPAPAPTEEPAPEAPEAK
jgi:hypothetical protein